MYSGDHSETVPLARAEIDVIHLGGMRDGGDEALKKIGDDFRHLVLVVDY